MNDRTPQEINDLRKENREQNRRIAHIEKDITEIKTTLIGIDGKNGMRREMQDIKASIEKLSSRSWENTKKAIIVIGACGAVASALYAVSQLVG